MITLGINTVESSTSICLSECLSNSLQTLSGFVSTSRNKTASMLIPYIDYVLTQSDKTIRDVDLISICSGPGSYTSLRIGYSTVKTLCIVNNIKLVEVSRFRLMCDKFIELNSVNHTQSETYIISVLPTTYGKVMSQRLVYNSKSLYISEVDPPSVQTVDRILDFANEDNSYVVGEFFNHKKAKDFERITTLDKYLEYQDKGDSAFRVSEIGYNLFASGVYSDPSKAEPLYIISPF